MAETMRATVGLRGRRVDRLKTPAALWLTESDVRRFWSKVALPDETGCMLWTRALDLDGYGYIKLSLVKTSCRAHRISLVLAAGDPPNPDMFAIHSCRNRHCVAPAHLHWGSHAENEADKLRDGTILRGDAHPRTKLTDNQAREIRQRFAAGGVTYRQLAAEYGVYPDRIGLIVRGAGRFAGLVD